MKSQEILVNYSDLALNKLSSDKIEEAINLRLPRSVIIQESAEALDSMTYVAKALAPSRPPTYAFLKLLMDAPNHALPIESFQEKVFGMTKEMMSKAESGKGLSANKNYKLYLRILKTAWEDSIIERSEALLLESLRNELGIWVNEHLLLEHHPDITNISNFSSAYITARNHLLITGLVLTHEHNYILSDEVYSHIRKIWRIDLEMAPYLRFLNMLTKVQLYNVLEKTSLPVSGSKEEQIQRIVDSLIPPSEVLDIINIEELRELSKEMRAPSSGLKADVIVNIIEHLDQNRDLVDEEKVEKTNLPLEPEKRVLSNRALFILLQQVSIDQLYDILSASYLKTSGSKEIKINRLVESPWSERSMLEHLRRTDIINICRRLGVPLSGVKNELIDRLIEWSSLRERMFSQKVEIENELTPEIAEDIEKENISGSLSELIEVETNRTINAGLKDLKKEYSDLEQDELTILSLIKEIKSLTEQDVEKTSVNHNFEWFLTKAHMAEMVSKLKRNGNCPIQIKSVKSTNIYEWCGDTQQNKDEYEKIGARNIINALRHGVVPEDHLDLLFVGQDNARKHLTDLLEETNDKRSAFKFIRGPYGAGKTFFCSWLRQYALDNEYAVSLVNIGPDQPLSDLPLFFSGIVNGLRTPEKRDSSALQDILESWLLSIHRATAQIEGLDPFDNSTKAKLTQLVGEKIESKLESISTIDSCFPPALRTFYHSRLMKDQVTASNAIAWLSGSRSMPSKKLNEIGVKGYLEANQVFPRIRALLEIIGGSRFKGLLLIVDELELIRKFPHAHQREQALETLRLLIDETGKNMFPGCLLVFTGTDEFFEDGRAGLKSYEALHNRVAIPGGPGKIVSVKQPVICLEGLNQERLFSVVCKVRDIHGRAYHWNAHEYISNDYLNKLTKDWTAFGDESISRKPRPVLRELINILDVCEENPNVDLNDFSRISVDEQTMAREIGDIFND